MNYYKNKYIISLYDSKDHNVGVLDNITQFANHFKISYANACVTLNKLFSRKIDFVRKDGECLKVYFYRWSDDEYNLKGA